MRITLDQINLILNHLFKDLSIGNINYSIGCWQFDFGRQYEDAYSNPPVNGLRLTAHDIEVVNETEWLTTIRSGPFDVTDSIDYEDSIKALVIFHLARLPIQKVKLNNQADFYLHYSKNRYLKVKGMVEVVDWVWWLDIGEHEKVIISHFGEVEFDEAVLKRYEL